MVHHSCKRSWGTEGMAQTFLRGGLDKTVSCNKHWECWLTWSLSQPLTSAYRTGRQNKHCRYVNEPVAIFQWYFIWSNTRWVEGRNAGQFALQQLTVDLRVTMVQHLRWVERAGLFDRQRGWMGCGSVLGSMHFRREADSYKIRTEWHLSPWMLPPCHCF